MEQNINEKFFIPDTKNLIEAGSIENVKLYTSNKLKRDFIDAINKSKVGNYIGESIEKLVIEGRINPCWLNKRLGSVVSYRFFSDSFTKNIEGFFDNQTKKVYIFLDTNTNFFNYSTNNNLARITIHETLHMFAVKRPKLFFSLFKKELENFYNNYFENIFDIRYNNVNYRTNLLLDLLESFPRKYGINKREIIYYGNIIDNIYRKYSALSEEEFNNQLRYFLTAFIIMVSNINSYIRNHKQYDDIIYEPLKETYKKVFKKYPKNKLFCQEIYSPSEIISVASEINITKNMIKGLSYLK